MGGLPRFPDDLVRAQQAWNTTYQALAVPSLRRSTVLRRRLLRLSVLLHIHPFWSTVPGRTPAARVELRRQAVGLSSRQEAVLRAVREWIAEHGEGSSVRQIGARVGLSSASSVAYQLGRLEEADQPGWRR